MSRRRLHFTERRRRQLAVRIAHLDRLETRNTITEPISVLGLSTSALRGLAAIGIMEQAGLSGSPLRRLQDQTQVKGPQTAASHAVPANTDIPITTGLVPRSPAGAAGGGAAAQATAKPTRTAPQGLPVDWLAQISSNDSAASQSQGIAPPGTRRLGRAAGPRCRRGAGRAMGAPVTTALVQGHTAVLHSPPPPPSTPAIPFLPHSAGSAGGGGGRGAGGPAITRNAAASHLGQGGSAGGAAGAVGSVSTAPPAGTTSPVTINENPSSLPSSTAGNGSGFSRVLPLFPTVCTR